MMPTQVSVVILLFLAAGPSRRQFWLVYPTTLSLFSAVSLSGFPVTLKGAGPQSFSQQGLLAQRQSNPEGLHLFRLCSLSAVQSTEDGRVPRFSTV